MPDQSVKNFTREATMLSLRNVIVDRKNRFLYCYVPKVASSNIRRLVLAIQGKAEDPNAIEKFDRRGFEFLGDFSPSERDYMIKSYFKFMFVRHPLERLVSAYRHRVKETKRTDLHKIYAEQIVKKYRNIRERSKKVTGDDVSFRELIRYLLDVDSNTMDPHFRPFFDICHPCLIRYNFIGSMENLDLDVSALLKKLNSTRKITFPKRQEYYNTLTKDEALMYYKNITATELIKLRLKYYKDFKCFIYSREMGIKTLLKSSQA